MLGLANQGPSQAPKFADRALEFPEDEHLPFYRQADGSDGVLLRS